MSLFVGFDVGTQGTKGVVIDVDAGEVVARGARAYGLIEGLPGGAAEQDPVTWWDAIVAIAQEWRSRGAFEPTRVAGIGISGQQHGLVPLDATGKPLRPAKLWCDTTAVREAEALSDRLGRHVPVGFTAPKLMWLAEHEPEVHARLRTVLLPHDWIDFRLTGSTWMEAGDVEELHNNPM